MREELLETDASIVESLTEPTRASVHEIYIDMLALHQEFDEVAIDRQTKSLSVTTEPLELEHIYLGPFEIQLDWKHPSLRIPLNYCVVAQDPHPASSDSDVTHPHVQRESVCEGDGGTAITAALQQGRLLDFFMIVASLLRTYNASSPYVSLSAWNGVECADCGELSSDEDSSRCEECETMLCNDCQRQCGDCQHPMCNECVSHCETCHDPHCDSCLKTCLLCSEQYCQTCVNEDICRSCHDENQIEKAKEKTDVSPTTTATL